MPSVIPFRKPEPPRDYGEAWRAGSDYGQRCANQRYLWIGIVVGCVLAAAIVLTALYFTGATK